jgi:CBS-domain-containing membrane protein
MQSYTKTYSKFKLENSQTTHAIKSVPPITGRGCACADCDQHLRRLEFFLSQYAERIDHLERENTLLREQLRRIGVAA